MATPTVSSGIERIADGLHNLSIEKTLNGAKVVILGAIATECSLRVMHFDDPTAISSVFKQALLHETGMTGAIGAINCLTGIQQRNIVQITKGALLALIGAASSASIYIIDPKMTMAVYQLAICTLVGLLIINSEFNINTNTGGFNGGRLSFFKIIRAFILMHLAALHFSNYFNNDSSNNHSSDKRLYSTIFRSNELLHSNICRPDELLYSTTPQADSLSHDQVAFLETHKTEIETMYGTGQITSGKWEKLGNGISKIAVQHPELPGMIIKIPIRETGFRTTTTDGDLLLHYENLKQAQQIATSFNRIAIPNSYLFQTSKGKILVEQKLEFLNSYAWKTDPHISKTIGQYCAFIKESQLCDVGLYRHHNARLVAHSTTPKVAIFDFDCKAANQNFDMKDCINQFFVPKEQLTLPKTHPFYQIISPVVHGLIVLKVINCAKKEILNFFNTLISISPVTLLKSTLANVKVKLGLICIVALIALKIMSQDNLAI